MDTISFFITAECTSLLFMSDGLQMIVQSSNVSEAHKLYVNQSRAPQTPVTVQVEREGLYQVTILGMRGGRGILDSRVKYTEQVEVSANSGSIETTTHAITVPSSTTPTTTEPISSTFSSKQCVCGCVGQ